MLSQNLSVKFAELGAQELRLKLKAFFSALCFRYRFCISSDSRAFPVSIVIDYVNAASCLFSAEQRRVQTPRVMEATLLALEALEELWPSGRIRSAQP
jgi:hypothetical protein